MWRVSLLFVGACSFAVMPPPHAVTPVCDDSYQAPVPDTIIGGALLASAVGIGVFGRVDHEGPDTRDAYWLALVPTALLFSASAIYGYVSRSRCEHVREESRLATGIARHESPGR